MPADTGIPRGDLSASVLRTTPPRAPRNLLPRARLSLDNPHYRERQIIAIQAPIGFGKTSLLAQWRREFLTRGAAVAWVTAYAHDDPARFLFDLVQAVRSGCGRPAFGHHLTDDNRAMAGEFEGITAWLAEVAQTSLDIVLFVDEAERLAVPTQLELSYLLHNAPPNLRVVLAARGGLDSAIADLCAYGECVAVGPEVLRFRLDETLVLVHSRLGGKVDADTCARLHEATEGWPLGLQLALAAVEAGRDPKSAVNALLARSGDPKDQLMGGLVASLDPEDADFLTRISVVELLHPDLCQALTGRADAAERLARLARETPFLVQGDDSDWSRLHTLAREAFRARGAELPAEEIRQVHARAMEWFMAHGLQEEAARHAHAAGKHEAAYELAGKCLYEATRKGRLAEVRNWLALLPEAELNCRPRLRLAVAWVLALSERHEEAEALVHRILDGPEVDEELRYECALIASGAAYYADEPDRSIELFAPWLDRASASDAWLQQVHANRLSAIAIMRGNPAQARRFQQQLSGADTDAASSYALQLGEFFKSLSYWHEGQVILCEETLGPALAKADGHLGRRHPLSCMLAALLAAVAYERDRTDEAAALLANRLDVLERSATPDTALYGYRTAARVAAAQGTEHRALDLLEELFAMAEERQMPRLCAASLLEQVRLHAARYRSETCRELTDRLDAIVTRCDLAARPLWAPMVLLSQSLAHVYMHIGAKQWPQALTQLGKLMPLVETLKLPRYRIEFLALKAFASDRNSDPEGKALLEEAMTLAETFGFARTIVDIHPALADWAGRIATDRSHEAALAPTARPPRPADSRTPPSMVLTPKEREVLDLLARNLSNKEIAQAMAVSDETVKWHLKNVFAKLDAGTRRHAVRRARLLGLLADAD